MDNYGRKLSVTKGMKQGHYAAIQSRITNDIERLTKELKLNKELYVSCPVCNKIFHIAVLFEGTCLGCAPRLKEMI